MSKRREWFHQHRVNGAAQIKRSVVEFVDIGFVERGGRAQYHLALVTDGVFA